MTIILSLLAGALSGIILMCVFLCAKSNEVCGDCPYKLYYLDNITKDD